MMKNQFFSLRFQSIRSHLISVLMITSIMMITLLLIKFLMNDAWLTLNRIFLFVGIYVFVGTIFALIIGFQSSGSNIKRLHEVSALISQYANGNYHYQINF